MVESEVSKEGNAKILFWSPETGISDFGSLGVNARRIRIKAMNDHGALAGYWEEDTGESATYSRETASRGFTPHPFVWDEVSGMTELKVEGFQIHFSSLSLSNQGDVLGVCMRSSDRRDLPFSWSRGKGFTFAPALPLEDDVYGLNTRGDMVGTYVWEMNRLAIQHDWILTC